MKYLPTAHEPLKCPGLEAGYCGSPCRAQTTLMNITSPRLPTAGLRRADQRSGANGTLSLTLKVKDNPDWRHYPRLQARGRTELFQAEQESRVFLMGPGHAFERGDCEKGRRYMLGFVGNRRAGSSPLHPSIQVQS